MGKAGPGYRKPKTKKYFTKKDIISTSIIAVIVIIAVVVLGVVISRDDFIRTKDGKLEMEDNWIISNYSDSGSYMYYKLGEVGEIEGYTLSEGSAQSPIKIILADDENASVPTIYIGTFEHNYATAAESMAEFYADTYGPIDVTVCGREAKYITSFASGDDAAEESDTPAEDAEAPVEDADVTEDSVEVAAQEDIWVMVAYVNYDEDHCIYIQLNADYELPIEEAEAYLQMVADSITLVER